MAFYFPPNLPKPTPKELTEGSQAIGEAAALAEGLDLSNRKQLNKLNNLSRADTFDGHLHGIIIFGTYALFIVIALMFVTLVLQYILPDSCRYLSEDEAYKLQDFLFSGVLGGVITTLSKRIISEKDD